MYGQFFCPGGGGGGSEPLPKKFLQLAHIFTKQRKETRVIITYNMMHKDKPTYEVKIFLHLNILFELITLDTIVGCRVNIGIFSINVNK